MRKNIKNIAASARARLLAVAKDSGRDFNSILLQYFQERFLYRLSISPYKHNFILKGALLYLIFEMPRLRPTKDIDFLGTNIANSADGIVNMFSNIIRIEENDGVKFAADSLDSELIKEDADYQGIRIYCTATLGNAKRRMQFDIAFGDIIIPNAEMKDFPVLLKNLSVPTLMTYSIESVFAEKYETIVKLNFATSRMKDFYDIYFMVNNLTIDPDILKKAIKITFKNRSTDLSSRSVIYTKEFVNDATNQMQWNAFITRIGSDIALSFKDCVVSIRDFVENVLK